MAETLQRIVRFMLAVRPIRHLAIATTLFTFGGNGRLWWAPSFLQRSHGSVLHPARSSGAGSVLGWATDSRTPSILLVFLGTTIRKRHLMDIVGQAPRILGCLVQRFHYVEFDPGRIRFKLPAGLTCSLRGDRA